jgi:hypothetical protein
MLDFDEQLIGTAVTEDDLRALKPFDFRAWVIRRFNGTQSPRELEAIEGDRLSFMDHEPIQVKQCDHVGRSVVDNFETAVECNGRTKGYLVAFSFTRGAYEEAARAKATTGIDIELVPIAELLTHAP